MHAFKNFMVVAAVAGLSSGCIINTGGTDTNLTLSTLSNGTTEETGSTTETGGTEGTGTTTETGGTEGTTAGTAETTSEAPTTGAPTTTSTTEATTAGAALCGWNPREGYYICGFEGEDPDGMFPIACPGGLAEGDPCTATNLTSEGCCDADGNNWYCANEVVVLEPCA